MYIHTLLCCSIKSIVAFPCQKAFCYIHLWSFHLFFMQKKRVEELEAKIAAMTKHEDELQSKIQRLEEVIFGFVMVLRFPFFISDF